MTLFTSMVPVVVTPKITPPGVARTGVVVAAERGRQRARHAERRDHTGTPTFHLRCTSRINACALPHTPFYSSHLTATQALLLPLLLALLVSRLEPGKARCRGEEYRGDGAAADGEGVPLIDMGGGGGGDSDWHHGIRIRHLRKRYRTSDGRDIPAIDDLTLDLHAGQVLPLYATRAYFVFVSLCIGPTITAHPSSTYHLGR